MIDFFKLENLKLVLEKAITRKLGKTFRLINVRN